MSIESGYYIERLSHSKLVDLARLHNAVYNRKVPVSFFEKNMILHLQASNT